MGNKVVKLASQRTVVIFGVSNRVPCGGDTLHGAGCELDKDPWGKDVERALAAMVIRSPPVPAVFIDGRLVGPTDQHMTLHLGGQLVPLLSQVGALWL